MKNILFPLLAGIFVAQLVSGQKAELFIKSGDNGLFLVHKVAPRESFYSVGRLYNVSPKFMASFNKLDMGKGLFIDQKIRIPLTDTNFTQKGNSGTPVYYKTGDKIDLAKISAAHKNVPVANLKRWNNLSTDQVKEGTRLIIGFLISREMPSVTIAKKPVPQETIVKKDEKPVGTPLVEEIQQPENKEELKKAEPVVVKEELKPVSSGGGFFKWSFDQQAKTNPPARNETLTSGIFKTTSGWEDAKYYLLMDGVQPGTIIKIINPENNKTIFAKVLGEMSGIRQNEGLNIRISNAAASALQIPEQDKFVVKVNY